MTEILDVWLGSEYVSAIYATIDALDVYQLELLANLLLKFAKYIPS